LLRSDYFPSEELALVTVNSIEGVVVERGSGVASVGSTSVDSSSVRISSVSSSVRISSSVGSVCSFVVSSWVTVVGRVE